MIISLIVAMDQANGIGKGGRVPWHLHDDLQRFKRLTLGHHVIMGRKTFESLGRPLPGRTNIVITRKTGYAIPAGLIAGSLNKALELAEEAGETEAFVIGGGEIYTQALPLAQRIYMTRVEALPGCDTFFPSYDAAEWESVESSFQPANSTSQFDSTFYILERVSLTQTP